MPTEQRSAAGRLAALILVSPLLLVACAGGDKGGDLPGDAGRPQATTTTGQVDTSGGGPPTADSSIERTDGEIVIAIDIVGGQVQGGVQRRSATLGAQVTLRVTSDVADELHVHTYDLRTDLVPGQSADLTLLAKTAGVIVVELEQRGEKVLELDVRP